MTTSKRRMNELLRTNKTPPLSYKRLENFLHFKTTATTTKQPPPNSPQGPPHESAKFTKFFTQDDQGKPVRNHLAKSSLKQTMLPGSHQLLLMPYYNSSYHQLVCRMELGAEPIGPDYNPISSTQVLAASGQINTSCHLPALKIQIVTPRGVY